MASEIERLVQEEGCRYRDVAVFYRTNAQSRVLEDVFMRAGMPYRVVGGRPVLPAAGGQGRPGLPAGAW